MVVNPYKNASRMKTVTVDSAFSSICLVLSA